ncbi:unnamed protein product [Parascedosporium putredinis]|uniref:DUF3500 domain-containing protein n=1 Tax=Parascedosporium putredinis TaxID=1442378 RepID=A0A9P1MFH6_9PEZI|nr:unnamed protein product [Parascedosporium putredinis]CAI8005037.1 unnamed protein product [Parascedosporium putredinis]
MASQPDAGAGSVPESAAYRQFLPDLTIPRFTTMQTQDAHEYAAAFKQSCAPRGFIPYTFTGGGCCRNPSAALRTMDIVGATEDLVAKLQANNVPFEPYHIDSPEWRTWSNPEFLLSHKGVRLDELTDELRASAVGAMRINGYLGELVKAPRVCNEFSYNFVLFGTPSVDTPWGFSFYGHHLCLNIFLYKGQIVVSPWFTGAEPNIIDDGPYKGTRILLEEEKLGLKLMQSLPAEQQAKAQVYELLHDPKMPKGRWNHDDQRHLCGAYRDNRVVPYEGVLVADMAQEQQDLVAAIIREYNLYLPPQAKEVRVADAVSWFKETYFCWIGSYGDDDAFYYRIQSPVVIIEFDHHSGVFLTNKEPAKFHIHTLLRTPNAGDYGMALRPLIPGREQKFLWEG